MAIFHINTTLLRNELTKMLPRVLRVRKQTGLFVPIETITSVGHNKSSIGRNTTTIGVSGCGMLELPDQDGTLYSTIVEHNRR
jgi:hypothetical protein